MMRNTDPTSFLLLEERMAGAPPPNQQTELPSLVRNFVHYDNLASNYSKQASGARHLRNEYESKVIHALRSNNMENAIIQVAGARLQCAEEKSAPSLSMPRLQQYLDRFYAQKGTGVNETEAILRFIRLQKANDTQTVACLKKISIPTNIPAPPPVGGGLKQIQ
jgi:hypothetical protein